MPTTINSTRSRRLPARLRVLGVVAICTTALVGVTSAAPGAQPSGGVDPANVELTLGPGQSATVAKHVTTPVVAPRPDIVILGDTTGSMDPVIANVRNNIDTIVDRVRASQPTARFGIAAYKEEVNQDKVFTVFTPLTDDIGAVRTGIDNMSHDVFGGGMPWTDFLNAHFRIATDAMSFRPDGSRIILWFGDAASHDPSLGHTLADTNNVLRALGARVIAVPVVGTSGDGLDRLGQASAIVNATRGRLMANSNADQVTDALLAGLENLDVTVTPHVNSCDPQLTVGFDAASRTVRSGTVADFGETVQAKPDAPAGTYHCSIDFLVDGVSAGLVQTTSVHVPGLSVGDVTVTEGDSGNTQAVFPVTLDRPANTPVTVHFATSDGTATAPGDYLTTSVDVPFAVGEVSKPVAVPIVGDTVPENTETFAVTLSAPRGAAVAAATGVGTILDNDSGGDPPQLSIGDVRVVEGNAGTTRAVFPISLNHAGAADVTVRATTADGTATVADNDYAALDQTVTIPAGQTSGTVGVAVNGDTRIEPDETFAVGLSAPVNASIVDETGVGTIANDDPGQQKPVVSIGDASVVEGNSGTSQAVFTISLDRAPTQGDVSVHWASADGTATVADHDFAAAGGEVTFTAGQTSRTVPVTINGDTTVEPDETFAVVLSAPVNADLGDSSGVGTIRNDDPAGPRPGVRISDASVAEGDSGSAGATFTISLDSAPGDTPVEVDWATADGTATLADNDYVGAGRRETFTGNQTSRTIPVDVNGDTAFEPDETFGVRLSNVTGGSIVDGDGVGTIRNDDPQPPRLSVSDVTVREGDSGTTQATFTVSLDRPSTRTVRVHAATHDGTASAGDNDYVATARDLTFDPNVLSLPFAVDVKGDNTFELDETFSVALTDAVNADLADDQGVGTIRNDDGDPAPSMSIGDVSVLEGDSGTSQAMFTISLDRAPTRGDVRVHWATSDGTATDADHDYNAASGDVVFHTGETSQVVSIGINGDETVEPDETFLVRLSGAVNADVLDGEGTGTIRNDDPPTDLRLSIGDTSVFEGNSGTTRATFTITLNQAPVDGPVTVRWATRDGSAVAGSDYAAASGVAQFDNGVASRNVMVDVNGDTTIEGDESFTVALSNATGGARIVDATGVGTIRNDDGATPPPAPRLSIGDTSLGEGNAGTTPATFTVTLANGPATGDVSVDYATHDGSAAAPGDYTATANRLVFHQGEVSRTIQVPVVGDTAVEPDETFTVVLTGASAGTEIAAGTGTATIRNDDTATPPTRPVLSIGDSRVIEGNGGVTHAVFTVSLNRPAGSTDPITVDYATSDGTATTADHDYTGTSGQLVFTGAKTSDVVIVDVLGDGRVEPDETFAVTLSGATGADISAPGRGTGTIANDDTAGTVPQASIGDVTVTEGNNGRTRATFTVTLDRQPDTPAQVHYATTDATAVSPVDYVATSGDLTFAGTTSQPVTVDVVGDLAAEPTETFTVALSAPSGLTIADGTGVATILDDDPTGTGVFTCTATALNGTSSTANPATNPCRDDSVSTDLVNINLGLLSIKGSGLSASTAQTPGNANAHAELASVRIRVLAVTIEVGMIASTATAGCAGAAPEFAGTSTVTALKINGLAVPIGSGPVHLPLVVGSLDLNTQTRTATSLTQTAFSLNTLLGNVTIARSTAGLAGNPCR